MYRIKTKVRQILNIRGFSLLETLLYISIMGVISSVFIFFFQMLVQARVQQHAISEVELQGVEILSYIGRKMRNAEDVSVPAKSESSTQLSMDVDDVLLSPTVFSLDGDRLVFQEGDGTPVYISSSDLKVENLTFINLGTSNTSDTVRIECTLSFGAGSSVEHRQTFYSTISLN